MLKELTDGNDHNINDTQSYVIEDLIHFEFGAVKLKKVPVNMDSQTK